jgi:hypothetical protein
MSAISGATLGGFSARAARNMTLAQIALHHSITITAAACLLLQLSHRAPTVSDNSTSVSSRQCCVLKPHKR